MIIAPFPFEALPRLTRADVLAQARVRNLAAKYGPIAEVERALGETVNAPVRIRFGRGRGVLTDGVTASLDGVVVNVEVALARDLVARALKHPPGIDAGKRASPALHGAFASVLVHALRKIGSVRLGQTPAEKAIVVRLAVEVAGATFDASVTVPDRVIAPPAPPASLDFAIALPIVAMSCLSSRGDLSALTLGDVFLPTGLSMTALALVAPGAERGLAVELTSGDRLVIGKETHHSWEPPMSVDSNNTAATLEVALEAPVIVRVELGAVEMKAREWAALAEGDVISLQRKLGEPAILRIAGNEVARGELVQVDGEYGIRITSTTR